VKIGELARVTGTKAETIRYYERVGLLPRPERTGGNYRDYGDEDQSRLSFIHEARQLGFDMAEIRSMLELADDPRLEAAKIREIALANLDKVQVKMHQLARLRSVLVSVVEGSENNPSKAVDILGALGPKRADRVPADSTTD
jgi:DNA-binding transcriptional MerR regulator